MTSGAAAVALAASALFALPAAADPVAHSAIQLETRLGNSSSLRIQVGGGDYYRTDRRQDRRGDYRRNSRHNVNEFGQTKREVRRLRRDAVRSCAARIERRAYRIGFRDVDFDDDRRVRQLGPYGFRIRFNDVEFESRRRDVERDVTCIVRRGNIVEVTGIPRSGNRAYRTASRNDEPLRGGRNTDRRDLRR